MDLAGGRRESGEIDGVEVEKRNEDATRVKKKKLRECAGGTYANL